MGSVEAFVHHLGSGEDVPIGPVWLSKQHVGIDWSAERTHILLRERIPSDAFMLDVYSFVGIDAKTGLKTRPLLPEDGWTTCDPGFVVPYEQGFRLCRTTEGSYDTDFYSFDPATGETILLADEDVFLQIPGRESDDKGYYPLEDGRYITGQSLPGFPDFTYEPAVLDRQQMFLVDPEQGMRYPLMKMLTGDVMTVSRDSRLIAHTDSIRGGFYIRPLPPASPPD